MTTFDRRRLESLEDPTPDYHLACFRRQLARDAALVQVMSLQPRARDAEEFFFDEQCPSDATFR